MAEIDDEELATLRTAAAEAEEAKKQREAEAQRAAQLEQRLSMSEQTAASTQQLVREIAQNFAPQGQPVQEEDEETVRLKNVVAEAVGQQMSPVLQGYFANSRQTNREIARQKYGETFGRFEKEIEDLLSTYPPNVAGGPGAYDAAFQAVRAKHMDEIIAEEVAKRTGDPGAPTPAAATRRVGSPTPTGGRATPTRSAPAQTPTNENSRFQQLSEAERAYVEDMGIDPKDYDKYNDPKYTEDIMGFKGRDAV